MRKKMEKIILILLFLVSKILAAPVGSQFSYQGQLQFNDNIVNGSYDLKFEVWSTETGGGVIGSAQIIEDVIVENGIFNVTLDFGEIPFSGDDVFLKIQVREGASTGSFTQLSPRQRINTVPYAIQAEFLAANGAIAGQVLKFNGQDWLPGNDNVGTSLWNDDANGISTTDKVGVGSVSSSTTQLQISAPTGTHPLKTFVNGQPKFEVANNGGVSIGSNINVVLPPANGLYVFGETELNQQTTITDELIVQRDAKHSRTDSYGFAKAGIEFSCGMGGTVRKNYFNNINTTEITVSNGSVHGSCVVNLPFAYDDLFYQTTVGFNGTTPLVGACAKETQGGSNQVTVCRIYNISTGSNIVIAENVTLLMF